MQKNNVKKAFLVVLLVAALYAIPTFVKNAYVLRVCVYVTIYSIRACSLNLISGVAGQVSMGHAAFYGIGVFYGGVVGGLIIGLTEVYTAAYIGSNYRNIPAFIILILVLFLRPTGLFGAKQVKKV